jgi:tuberous sclerosis protein 2
MRNLMGTHLGHSALYNLCQIIQTSTSATDIALIRGAVFFIGKELTYQCWGSVTF